jgi:5-methylcytosine-specific restriction endonuclease McrA
VRSVPRPSTISSDLSPYIAASLRRRGMEEQQRRALLAAASDAGITPLASETLQQAVSRQLRAEKYLRRVRGRDARRRAKLAGATVEVFTREEIIARDKATCYLCDSVTRLEMIHLDHVIPLSRGGDHSRANVRVACATCNLAKGDLTEAEYRATLRFGLTRT